MASKKSGKRKGHPRRHLHAVPSPRPSYEEQPLIKSIRGALRTGEPLDLLMSISTLLEVTDSRHNPMDRTAQDEQRGTLIDSFLDIAYAETTAALIVIRALVSDEALSERISRELANRRHPMPDWLSDLADARVVSDAVLITHELGDGDDYVFTVELASKAQLSVVIFIDHNMGSAVKDAFILPIGHDDLLERMRETMTSMAGGSSLRPADPADTRAIIESGIIAGARYLPQPESDTWPAARPLIDWMVRLLPAGGSAPEWHEWTDAERYEVADAFLASPFGKALAHHDARETVRDLMWLNGADPLRWSPAVVEILLLNFIPRKIIDEPESLATIPALMRAFIRYCHDQRGLGQGSTAETVAAVDDCEPDYLEEIHRDRGASAETARRLAELVRSANLGGGDSEAPVDLFSPSEESDLAGLDRKVGGRAHLLSLDASPLPDEEIDLNGVADDILAAVDEIRVLCDECADTFFDIEHRTAMRRFLARAARANPAIFRRKSSAARSSAAVAWVIGRANETLNGKFANMTVAEMMASFGVKGSSSQRAEALLKANGVNPHRRFGRMDLGTPDLLTAQMRAEIIRGRDRLLAD